MKSIMVVVLAVVVFASADTMILQPGPGTGKDTFIDTMYPDENYGGDEDMKLGAMTYEHQLLIEWDLSDLPEGAEINSATMSLYCWYFFGIPTGEIEFYIVTEWWDESTVNWENQPDYSLPSIAGCDWPETGEWININLTEYVQNWYDGEDNFGVIGLFAENGCIGRFRSSDYYEEIVFRPKLTIEYTPDDAGISPASFGAIKAVYR